MYIAELKGKLSRDQENKEDLLTSNVFSFLKYAPRELFLLSFLEELGLEVSKHDANQAGFVFWPTYSDLTEPDVVILIGKYYLLIEAKLYSGFGKARGDLDSQLKRELVQGQNEADKMQREFRLIAVTTHYSYQHFLLELDDVSPDFLQWISWHQIGLMLEKILESKPDISPPMLSFASDLYDLLIKKNLRRFSGLNCFFQEYDLTSITGNIFFDPLSADYRDDYFGFQRVFSRMDHIKELSGQLFFGGQDLFVSLINSNQDIHPVSDVIFLGGKE